MEFNKVHIHALTKDHARVLSTQLNIAECGFATAAYGDLERDTIEANVRAWLRPEGPRVFVSTTMGEVGISNPQCDLVVTVGGAHNLLSLL